MRPYVFWFKGSGRLAAALISLFCCLAVLAGCTPKETATPSVLDMPDAFSASGSAQIPDRWWTVFGDHNLNTVVDQALQANFNLKTAWQRLRQARAVVDRESSALFPDLEAVSQGEVFGTDSGTSEGLQLGLGSAYELDLWGRIESQVQAERFRANATLAEYHTALLSVSAEVVRTWLQLMEAWAQLDLLEQQIATNTEMLELITARFGSGLVRRVDILRQEQLLESTREQRLQIQSRIQVLEHRLSVLQGRPPQAGIEYEPGPLPDLPPLPDTGLPLDLIRRRPDVQSAYNRLQAADRDLAAAISNQYPRLTLSAAVSTATDNGLNLFEQWARSFSGNLTAPLLDAGQRAAEVDRTRALKYQRLFEYGQAVLTAFQEVEDALIQETKQVQRIGSLQKQLDLAQQAYAQLRTEYFNGINDFIDVLTALTQAQQLGRDLLEARLRGLEFRVALYRALAGGLPETPRKQGAYVPRP